MRARSAVRHVTVALVLAMMLAATQAARTTPPANPNCPNGTLPFCDLSLSFEARAADLVSRLTTAEKIQQISTFDFQSVFKQKWTPGIPRLGVPDYNYHTEGLHGIRDGADEHVYTTLYPQVTGMAATGNLSRIQEMAAITGLEARVVSNVAKNNSQIFTKGAGLSVYGPTINICRDPRWGRTQESVSEDPYLNGAYAQAFVNGIQKRSAGKYLQVANTCKHVAVYSLEDSDGASRHNENAIVSQLDLTETYLPAFEACTRAEPQQIMCSYNAINGVPACLRGDILNDKLRTAWGFKGSVVSDCDAIKDAYESHHMVATPADAAAQGILGGCDQDCGIYYTQYLGAALAAGSINTTSVDTALTRIFLMRFVLGEFDPDDDVPYRSIPLSAANSAEGHASALGAAREAIALLNNSAGVLPLGGGNSSVLPAGNKPSAASPLKIAVLGPLANDTMAQMGAKNDYNPEHIVTPLLGLQARLDAQVTYQQGCSISGSDTRHIQAAVNAAKAADVAVVVVGIDSSIEGEAHDRKTIGLPGQQSQLVERVAAAVGPERTVVVIVNGGPVSADSVRQSIPTVVDAFEGGQAGGTALADVLFGDVNPSGVLPYTVVPSDFINQVAMDDYEMRPNATSGSPGRTYRFYTGTPLWPFGWGLSYTTFKLEWSPHPPSEEAMTTAQAAAAGTGTYEDAGTTYSVTVTNTGNVAGARVVMAFASHADPPAGAPPTPSPPIKSLFGMDKVYLEPGKSATVKFGVERWANPFVRVGEDGVVRAIPANVDISVGHGGADGDEIVRRVEVRGDVVDVAA